MGSSSTSSSEGLFELGPESSESREESSDNDGNTLNKEFTLDLGVEDPQVEVPFDLEMDDPHP